MIVRKYETVTLVHPDAGPDGHEKVLGRMRESIEKTGGREVRLEDWGRRKLAYTLSRAGVNRAQYFYMLYLGTNETVAELERLMKITEEAMLWQSILVEDRVEMDTFDFEAEAGGQTLMSSSDDDQDGDGGDDESDDDEGLESDDEPADGEED